MISSYQEALDYIYSFVDPNRKAAASSDEALRNLKRMRALLETVGIWPPTAPTVVVAGTKGKGSTCALIEAICRTTGLRCGLWTSPHLSSYRERIQIDREPISQAELVALAEQLRPAIDSFDEQTYGRPSAFDIGFVLALHYFVTRQVDLAVIEVGLGGRYDVASVLTPLVAVISSISYDHMAILGSTLTEIANNKAGIMKPGGPTITIPQPPEAATVIEREARQLGCELWIAAPQGISRALPGPASSNLAYPVAPKPAQLAGGFQEENARLAIGTALLLRNRGLQIDDAAIATGLAEASWPGRFELVSGAPAVLIDGAHNGDSAQKLAHAIRGELRFDRQILVLGTSRDKDIAAIANALVPSSAAVILTRSLHPRAMDLDRIATVVQPYLRGPLFIEPEIDAALKRARGLAGPSDLIVVTGSLFVVAAARETLGLAVAD